jgi:SAM-dependent methyltransferase
MRSVREQRSGVLMGSAAVQGQLWGARAQDWATYVEQVSLPLFGAALDAARVTAGTRLLDAGCGAGLLALLASLRGAQVTAFDASPGLLAIARQRLPAADVQQGDLQVLPFADASFDAVTAVNSLFYAEDMAAAMRTRPCRAIGRAHRCDRLGTAGAMRVPHRCHAGAPAANAAPAAGRRASAPRGLSEPGALAAVVQTAGLHVVEEGEVACPFVFPNTEASWRCNASAGVNQAAIAHSGEAAVRAIYAHADRTHTRPEGSVRYENIFLWVAGEQA